MITGGLDAADKTVPVRIKKVIQNFDNFLILNFSIFILCFSWYLINGTPDKGSLKVFDVSLED
jgi:TRAP-type C4-dicarboxylate transport system permease small subunit